MVLAAALSNASACAGHGPGRRDWWRARVTAEGQGSPSVRGLHGSEAEGRARVQTPACSFITMWASRVLPRRNSTMQHVFLLEDADAAARLWTRQAQVKTCSTPTPHAAKESWKIVFVIYVYIYIHTYISVTHL